MHYKQRDVLLLPVPFTDLSSKKVRPVIVLSGDAHNSTSEDIIVIAITSQKHSTKHEIELHPEHMQRGYLPKVSYARADKIYTLSQQIVRKHYGTISEIFFTQLLQSIDRVLVPMPKVTAIIGKIAAGKTTYAKTLPGVLLSVDDFMLPLFGQECELIRKNRRLVEDYLLALAKQLLEKNIDVVLDWGFWTREDRARLAATELPVQWHYVNIAQQQRNRQIIQRNAEIETGLRAYYVHEGLAQRCNDVFEEPEEIDGLIRL